MSQDNEECDGEFERPSKSLVLTIFGLAVILKVCLIVAEILDFGTYLQGNGEEKKH